MQRSAFHRSGGDDSPLDLHEYRRPIPSPTGLFRLELDCDLGGAGPPDAATLAAARELLRLFERDRGLLTRLVHDRYRTLAESEPGWVAGACGLPLGLGEGDLAPHVRGFLRVVRDGEDEDEPHAARVHVSPARDPEQGIHSRHEGGARVEADA